MKINLLAFHQMPRQKILRMVMLLSACCLILYVFLIMPNTARQKDLKSFSQYMFAHRGLHDNERAIPENSLIAFQKAIDYGYGIELDVQLTKDKIPVVLHDYNLQRVTGENIIVSTLTYDELCEYTLFDTTEHIPTLRESLELINGQVPVMIELKVGLNYNITCQNVFSLLSHYKGNYAVISFSPLALQWFRTNAPHVLRGQLSTNYAKDHMQTPPIAQFMLTNLMFNFISRPDFISYNYEYASNISLTLCKDYFHCPTATWTITSPEQYEAVKEDFDMIVFDSFYPSTYTTK